MVLLLSTQEVLEVIDRKDPNVLWHWYARDQWFPAPSLTGRPSLWALTKLEDWIQTGIDSMYASNSSVPEMQSAELAIAYKKGCRDRLNDVVLRIRKEDQAAAEKAETLSRIVKVYRRVPVPA